MKETKRRGRDRTAEAALVLTVLELREALTKLFWELIPVSEAHGTLPPRALVVGSFRNVCCCQGTACHQWSSRRHPFVTTRVAWPQSLDRTTKNHVPVVRSNIRKSCPRVKEVGEMRSGKVMDAIGERRRRRWSVTITTHKAAPRVSEKSKSPTSLREGNYSWWYRFRVQGVKIKGEQLERRRSLGGA